MQQYSVKKLAKMAGVSVRTLHLYDQLGLLKPSLRTEARYRMYGEKELLRLQQILFYRELDVPLKEIGVLLDRPHFDLVEALQSHREALLSKQARIKTMLKTIDKTISHLKNETTMMNHEELYEGLDHNTAGVYRQEATQKWGAEAVETSEKHLKNLGKAGFNDLKSAMKAIGEALYSAQNQNPTSVHVQALIARHYEIIRQFWGTSGSTDTQAEAYAGLGQLYVDDNRYTMIDGQAQPAYAQFLSKAMRHFADTKLA
ncbi:MAG: MerR family transcriptional regulator [Spirosomaceae bacterium]|nr:MerR family transcriptional regulator [Spirosomataceae bacterium]